MTKKPALITGISELAPQKNPAGSKDSGRLAQAARLAIEDAALQKRDIDGLLVTPSQRRQRFYVAGPGSRVLGSGSPLFSIWWNWGEPARLGPL